MGLHIVAFRTKPEKKVDAPVNGESDKSGTKPEEKVDTQEKESMVNESEDKSEDENEEDDEDNIEELDGMYVGAYSKVQRIRTQLILYTLDTLKTFPDTTETASLITLIKSWLSYKPYEWISYEGLNKMTDTIYQKLPLTIYGMYNFLNHSDCDGKIDHQECKAIQLWMDQFILPNDTLKKYTSDPELRDTGNLIYYKELRNVFAAAAQNDGYVEFL